MASLNRIVLVDHSGDEIFSGKSLLSSYPPPPAADAPGAPAEATPQARTRSDDDCCPETLRSGVTMRPLTSSRPEIEVTIAGDPRAA